MKTQHLLVCLGLLVAGCARQTAGEARPALAPAAPTAEAYVFDFYENLGDHPLDRALAACLDGDPGTAGVTRCYDEFLVRYEDQLERNYERTLQLLGPVAGKRLENSQALWRRHLEAEYELIEAQYEGLVGSQYRQLMALERLIPVRHRSLALHLYAQALAADRE